MNKLLKEFLSYILIEARVKREVGAVWQTAKGWSAKRADRTQGGFKDKASAEAWLSGKGKAPGEETPTGTGSKKTPPDTTTTKTPGVGAEPKTPEPGKVTVPAPEGAENLNVANLANQIRNGIVSPGNDFSRYSESVSIFIAKSILDNPDASDQEVMERIIQADCGSKTLTDKVGVKSIPKHLKKRYDALKGVFDKCSGSESQNRARFMTMVVAQQKAERMRGAIERNGFTSTSVDSFSGDSGSKERLRSTIESLPAGAKIFTETGEELTREEALERVAGFGTARFPADTAMLGRDASGNVILMGFSDKKDLSAIINNSSISVEMEQTLSALDKLLEDKKITQEEHTKMVGIIRQQHEDYSKDEEELTTTVSEPAKLLSEASDEQLTDLVAKAKTASAGRDPEKYWRRVGKFKDQAKRKATEANEREYLQWLRSAGWDGTSEVSDELAMKAWGLKCRDTLEQGGSLSADDQELLFRLELVPKKQIVEAVAVIKQRAMKRLQTVREELDTIRVGDTPLGTYMDGVRAWHALHLDMREHKGSLSMVAEDTVVDYESIEECLGGISDRSSFVSSLDIESRDIRSTQYGVVTGTSVEIFALGGGQRRSIGVRSIRSKDGILGRLQTTWNFHPEFQKCLKSGKK